MAKQKKQTEPKPQKEVMPKEFDGRVKVGRWKEFKNYICQICGWSTTSEVKMKYHLMEHDKTKTSSAVTDRFGNKLKY